MRRIRLCSSGCVEVRPHSDCITPYMGVSQFSRELTPQVYSTLLRRSWSLKRGYPGVSPALTCRKNAPNALSSLRSALPLACRFVAVPALLKQAVQSLNFGAAGIQTVFVSALHAHYFTEFGCIRQKKRGCRLKATEECANYLWTT